jgi:hypothetical protein
MEQDGTIRHAPIYIRKVAELHVAWYIGYPADKAQLHSSTGNYRVDTGEVVNLMSK